MKATTPPNPSTSFKINIPLVVTHDDLSSLLCSAFEDGGHGDWKTILDTPEALQEAAARGQMPEGEWMNYPIYCVGHPDWAVKIVDRFHEDAPLNLADMMKGSGAAFHTLTLDDLKKGFKLFARKGDRHFRNWQSQNTDATTANVFLQFCLFGEVRYP